MNEILSEALQYALFHLAKAASAMLQRDSYLYWPYLLSAGAIALIVWRWGPRPGAEPCRRTSAFLDEYFSSRLWWHASARGDYWLYLTNALVVPLVFAMLLLEPNQFANFVGEAIGGSEMTGAESSGMAACLAFTVLFFIAYDLGRFIVHCLLHDVPFLWEFHKVHHSAEVLTPITSFRAHPLELLLMAWGPVVTTGVLMLAFNAIVADRVSAYTFLGTHAILFATNLIGNLRHSPVWLSYGPSLGRWLISPAHHQLHHSSELRHLGCNRGFELAIWDRLLGTLYVPGTKPEQFRLGLGDGSEVLYHSVGAMYFLPFARAAQRLSEVFRRSLGWFSAR